MEGDKEVPWIGGEFKVNKKREGYLRLTALEVGDEAAEGAPA